MHKVLVKRQDSNKDVGIHYPKKTGDVGYDLVVSETTVIPPASSNKGRPVTVPCNVSIKVPEGYWCQIVGRSSSARRGVLIHTAIIDTGYTGQMFACVFNVDEEPKVINEGDRVAQVVFFKAELPELEEVDKLPDTDRADTGFGSTGK